MEKFGEFCIISNNCWGGEVYAENSIPYNTPFIGLFVPPLCFAKLCNSLPDYLNKELQFISTSKYSMYNQLKKTKEYPLALLGDVEIHFLHYKNQEEASDKWKRRLKRMPIDVKKWKIKGCDREITDWVYYKNMWNKIPYDKVFFSAKFRPFIHNSVWVFEFSNRLEVVDGKSLHKYSKTYFNIEKWTQGKNGYLNLLHKISHIAKLIKNRLR